MIPKIIHYCWFGGNPLPKEAKSCIESWKKFFPGYEIKEWNESNYDVSSCEYTKEAAIAKKWAFVSDFARFDILYRLGGIYFDTDVEVIRTMEDILETGAFMGIESGELREGGTFGIASGLGIAAPACHPIYKEIIDYYRGKHFWDTEGKIDTTTVVTVVTNLLVEKGIEIKDNVGSCLGISIYPKDFFCPQDYVTGKITITNNTRSIHHYTATWMSPTQKLRHNIHVKCKLAFGIRYGTIIAKIISAPLWMINKYQKNKNYIKE